MKYTFRINGLIVLLFFYSSLIFGQSGNNFEISKNLDIYATLFKEINKNYVDEIDAGEIMKTGIDAMMESLDPYTVYISEAEVEDFKFITTGQYGGIGAMIHTEGDFVIISEPYEGKPAELYGLKAGDKILEVDGQSMKGKSTSDVSSLLKGQPGTKVSILIERPGTDSPIEKELERQVVKIDNIPYYGILKNDIAYIKLSGFTQNAGKEVKDAFMEMKGKQELEGVILDLRNNGGGLLQEAVNICNIFLDKGKPIVSTRGKLASKNQSYKTTMAPVDINIPLAVLVNGSSASASEIVAGAIQDHDRGVIVGQQTFGKGLVQNVIPLTYNSQAKITVARYYIPSGRCIQEIDYTKKDKNGHSIEKPDSLTAAFQTKNGRVVYDSHGIKPDVKVKAEQVSDLTIALMNEFLFFSFATQFTLEHEQIDEPEVFTVSDSIFEQFVSYINLHGYEYTTEVEESLKSLKETAEKEDLFASMSDDYYDMLNKVNEIKKGDVYKYKEEIEMILRLEIISRYYYQKGKIISSMQADHELEKAIELLHQNQEYLAILSGSEPGTKN